MDCNIPNDAVVEQELQDLEKEEKELFDSENYQGVLELTTMTIPNAGEKESIYAILRRIDENSPVWNQLWKEIF